MKNKILYLATLAFGVQLLGSCKKELDVNTQERITLDNYYKTPADAFAGLVAVYDRFGFQAGGLYDKVAIMDAACDDQLAGGGGPSDINDLQVISNYTLNANTGPQGYLWSKGYSGIFRANTLLAKIDGITMDAALKSRYVAETKTLRAIFYFDLVRFFKNIPLIGGTVDPSNLYNVLQSAPADVYAYIEKDLTEAIPSLPATVPAATEGGRITKGAAQALLGKVYLWQKKYQQAADQFAIVNGSTPGQANAAYGYKLITNFADLWKPLNKFNSESILEIVHSANSQGNWNDAAQGEGNLLSIISGPRGYSQIAATAPDYYSGYSFLVFTKEFFDFIHYDPRNKPTVANLDSLKANKIANYSPGYNNTGYFLEKFAARVSNKTTVGTNYDLNFPQDIYEIRLADTYLLEAEALMNTNVGVGTGSRAYNLLNAVRARVGLEPVAVTQANIEKERRLELAGEGHRWLDLVRWGKAATVLASKGFIAGRHEIFPIPQSELNNTKIEQNKEWGGTK
ncbi:MAG: RagB/SusD family nutrient uptake outer membrane protein [Sphingobacteriaceae bacterium]|nr:MAG: RagB/SusD family nutrient uptake outer membrane protein [Sphingobacteriaceae bacterium]